LEQFKSRTVERKERDENTRSVVGSFWEKKVMVSDTVFELVSTYFTSDFTFDNCPTISGGIKFFPCSRWRKFMTGALIVRQHGFGGSAEFKTFKKISSLI
jgi:hypothetical protein